MSEIVYLCFSQVKPEDLLVVVNDDSLRAHLIDHPYFNSVSVQEWIASKIKADATLGCRVRVVFVGGVLAGWCGIQADDDGFEIAIVISKKFWGIGIPIFKTMMNWAKELGHKELVFHLLDSRPEYKSLAKMSSKVKKTRISGRNFTTYHLLVS